MCQQQTLSRGFRLHGSAGPRLRSQAFRLLSSDLGKVFFKALGDNKYKAKAAKSVQASKDNFCRDPNTVDTEWCFV